MKKSIIKVLSVVLVVIITLTSAPLSGFVGLELPKWLDFSIKSSAAEPTSGTCGDNLTWTYDTSTCTLTVSGTGTMNDYNYNNRPWESYEDSIKIVVINNGVTTIGSYAFNSCSSLTTVTIPNSITTIGDWVFDYCDSLTSITVDSNNQYYSSDEYGVLFNKDKTVLIQYSIGNARSSYIIPDSVTTIGDSAFRSCYKLTSVTISDSVKKIGNYAFDWCDSLISVTIGDGVMSIGDCAFSDCTSLTSIIVDSDNQYYSSDEYGVLFNKDKTTLIQYPTGNTRTSYTIPDSVTSIGDYAFADCTSLTSVTIPGSVTMIGHSAFENCKSLNDVNINDMYAWCNISFGSGDANPLYCAKKLILNGETVTDLVIPDSVTTIGDGAFYWCDSITSVTIPDSVTTIGDSAFRLCYSLTSLTIGDGVTTIGDSAFSWCRSLASVTIGDSVTTIGDSAFYWCDSLTDVYYTGTGAQWNNISINSYNDLLLNATIHFNYHIHEYEEFVIPPTCTYRGYTTYTCECGDTYIDNYVDALGHTDGDIVEENYIAATCTETGSKDNVTYCTVCNAETGRKEIIIDATGHTEEEIPAVAPTCTEIGLTSGVKCSVCDEILTAQQELPASGHKYDSVMTAPTCTDQGYTTYTCICGESYVGDYTDPLGHNFENGTCTECNVSDPEYFTFEIQNPSRTTIRCNDGIKLHTSITGNLPEGSRIEWSKNNSNFNVNVSDSGNEITIISKNNGYTTFTATVYDADNKVIAEDTIEMYSKASFFDKIGGFFRSLFGGTKIYEN